MKAELLQSSKIRNDQDVMRRTFNGVQEKSHRSL